ncbi:TIGR03943 family protein [Actinoplanes sp. NPDC051633]|uniref:TIGR03943 family putative permease subunit n=1 Tax=Actinoplanes sp. NPDC051633 TaxID=3155670 RepID=UPI00341B138E
MNRQAQAVILLLFGGAIVKAGVTDLSLRYVKEGLRPFLVGAGLVLVAAAVATLWYELRRPLKEEHHHEPRVGWLLIVPVLGLLLVAPPALGSYAAERSGSVLTAQSQSDYPPLPPGDPAPISLLDYASRAVFDEGKSLGGRTLRLVGFVTQGADGQPMLTRMVLSCCAADGRPIKVGLIGDTPAGLAPDSWVRVDGVYTPRTGTDEINEAKVPYLEVRSWEQIAPPRNQYE